MAALVSWYSHQYGTWNRTRRLAAAPFLARTDTRASQLARTQSRGRQAQDSQLSPTQPQADVVINMNNTQNQQPNNAVTTPPANAEQTPKNKDTLFGPNIGVVSSGPGWTCADSEKKGLRTGKEESEKLGEESGDDELTPEIVRGWIAKSREPSEPTTTLQALVNLKRPTIRLSPLAHDPSHTHSRSLTAAEDPSASTDRLNQPHTQQHGLEFEFDCDAPKCAIAIHVVGVPASLGEEYHLQHHQNAAPRASTSDAERERNAEFEKNRLLVFETTLEGGFGRKLDLDAGATLELARLEQAAIAAAKAQAEAVAAAAAKLDKSAKDASTSTDNVDSADSPTGATRHKKRLTFFRRKHHNSNNAAQPNGNGSGPTSPTRTPRPVTGPALAVVDAEAHAPSSGAENTQGKPKDGEDEGGVKVTIRLSALDAEGRGPAFGARNEQTTYLHVVRVGTPPVRPEGGEEGESEEEDTRPWVVKVVKREATIGPHTFHLHEIYGLSSHSAEPAHPIAPTAPAPATDNTTDPHSYPPQAPPAPPVVTNTHADDDFTSECLLCLSSPREVVLLPCRHLVACRECAVNMVEFGAGGTLVHSESDQNQNQNGAAPGGTGGAEGGDAANATGANGEDAGAPSTGVVQAVPPPAPTRRKRKAKGWFCPVCRQPYTSLLRITTSPPPPKEHAVAKRVSMASGSDVDHDHSHDHTDEVNQTLATHPAGVFPYPDTTANAASTTPTQPQQDAGNGNGNNTGGGIIGGVTNLMRPGFLRSFTSRSANGRGPGTGANAMPLNATELVDLERGRASGQ